MNLKLTLIVAAGLLWQTTASAQDTPDCVILGTAMNEQAKVLSYADFEDHGWRTLAAKQCFFQSGISIVSWLSANTDTASPEQTRTLRYHAARVFAMSGRSNVALIHLKHARDPDQAVGAAKDWNAYIDTFSAWLRRDLADVRSGIAQLELQEKDERGYKPNLAAGKRFLTCYSLPYSAIETDPSCVTPEDEDISASSAESTTP